LTSNNHTSNLQPQLNNLGGGITDWDGIYQCTCGITATPPAPNFLKPTVGSAFYSYLDWPITSVTPQVAAANIESLTTWELNYPPLATVQRLSVSAT
jgi:phage baseplate assembly protein W